MESNKSVEIVPALSVIIPVYNSANIFPALYQRLTLVLSELVSAFEIVAVVDGCQDNSFEVIASFAGKDPRVKVVEFSRNFGHQAAVTAGLTLAKGLVITIMDDDLEDPPEVLPLLFKEIQAGADVVYGVRRKRKRSWLHRLCFMLFYRLLNKITDVEIPGDAGDFCMMKQNVVRILNSMPESNRYLRGLRAWTGFKQVGVEYARGERLANQSGYNFSKYFKLALDAMFSFSYKPLVYMSKLGLIIALISMIYGLYIFTSGKSPIAPGWASLFVSLLFFSGIQLLSIGLIGQYLARIYDEIKQRPKFIIKRSVGFES